MNVKVLTLQVSDNLSVKGYKTHIAHIFSLEC